MKQISLYLFAVVILFACRESKNTAQVQLEKQISSLEKQILQTGDASKNKETAKELVIKSTQFAKAYPDDEQTPDLLFKAADVARGAREYGRAVQLWGQVWREYGDHPKAPMALFLQGFTFDTDLNDGRMAAKYYRDFLQQYPNDTLAAQVKQLLTVVEVEPGELIRQFREAQ